MRLIVTGTRGQVARALVERALLHDVEVAAIGRPEIDLTEPDRVEAVLAATPGDIVINAAAYTAVDNAESEPALVMRVNRDGAAAAARGARKSGRAFIHLSTDYVYDGKLDRPYRESDRVGPVSAYGRSKLAGERAVAMAYPQATILRTAWVYSPFGANFLTTMLRFGEARREVAVVADQYGAPTSALDIADGLITIARKLVDGSCDPARTGIFHMTGAGEAVWADFAEEIFAEAARCGRLPVAVRRISTAEYPTPAQRPRNARLSNAKLAQIFGVSLPDWRASTRACVARLLGASVGAVTK